MHREITSQLFFYLSSLEVLEWVLLFNGMLQLHGVRGSQSSLH